MFRSLQRCWCLLCVGLFYGHTGHVRFLTSVELGRSLAQPSSTPGELDGGGGGGSGGGGSTPRRHATFSVRPSSSTPPVASSSVVGHPHRYRPTTPPPMSVSAAAAAAAAPGVGVGGGNTLVISGGDGFEDFRASSTDNESAGRDDSTNHLLLWRI